jgi:peroxiredoxin Q/BCP
MPDSIKIDLKIGETAPDFTLYTLRGEKINLYELLDSGKTVMLVFYPKDMTSGCTTQLCGIKDNYNEYKKFDITIYGINQDSAESHIRFTDTYSFPFELLIDEDRKTAQEYGAIKSIFGNIGTKRGVFIISPDKSIIYQVWGQQNNQEVLKFLENAKNNEQN